MDHVADIRQRELGGVQQLGEALERADRGVVRRGQAFVQADVVALRVEQDEIGEGAADVETDTVAVGGGHSAILQWRRLNCAPQRIGSQGWA